MSENEQFTATSLQNTPWIDPDDAPELDKEWFRTAAIHENGRLIRAGRPKGSGSKTAIKIRFDTDIVTAFRASGKGWQTRMNDAIREWVRAHPFA